MSTFWAGVDTKRLMRFEESHSIALEFGRALLKKRANSLLVVVAVVDLATEGLQALIGFWIQRMGIGQDPHFFLENAQDERGRLGDLGGQVHGEGFEFFRRDNVIDNARSLEPVDGNGLGSEEHLLEQMDPCHFNQIEGSVKVVRHTQFGWSNGKGGVSRCNDQVTAKNELACATPDRPFDHGDYGLGQGLDFADELAEGVVIGEGVSAVGGEFVDVVAGRKYAGAFGGAENDGADVGLFQFVDCGRNVVEQAAAEGIDAAVIHGDGADAVGD